MDRYERQSAYEADKRIIEAHKLVPQYCQGACKWVEFSPEARAFAAKQALPRELGTAEGLPPGWLAEFVACSAYHKSFGGKQFRRVPAWVPSELRKMNNACTSAPDGAVFTVVYVDTEAKFVSAYAYYGRVVVEALALRDAIVRAQKSLAREAMPYLTPTWVGNTRTSYSLEPARERYPHALPKDLVARARTLAPLVGGDDPDIATWLAAITLAELIEPGYTREPQPIACMPSEMPTELLLELRGGPLDAIDTFLEKYGLELYPVGRIRGDRYYLWIYSVGDGAFYPYYVEVNATVRERVRLWKENPAKVEPERITKVVEGLGRWPEE